jgi:hypothetical protein
LFAFGPEKIGDRNNGIDEQLQEQRRDRQCLARKVRPGQYERDSGVT